MVEGRFAGRVAIITGAAQGIGRAVAERFAADDASVVIADLNAAAGDAAAASIESSGGVARAVRADVTEPVDAARIVAAAIDAFGRIDVLVNNAGILRSTRAADVDAEEWRLVIDANLTGAFLCARAAYPALRASGRG
ncbi:MAG TPA: SDR family NAD(P)-dependent oxidoreductase, partial [Candidatus Limnocylindrales bacterium]